MSVPKFELDPTYLFGFPLDGTKTPAAGDVLVLRAGKWVPEPMSSSASPPSTTLVIPEDTITGTVYTLSEPAGGAAGSPITAGSDVSINIFNSGGRLVRTLYRGSRLAWGQYDLATQWDGRDNAGVLVPAGNYTARLIQHQGLITRHEFRLGDAGLGNPLVWMPGNHNGTTGAGYTDNTILFCSSSSEFGSSLLRINSTTFNPEWQTNVSRWQVGTAVGIGHDLQWTLVQDTGEVVPTRLGQTGLENQQHSYGGTRVYGDKPAMSAAYPLYNGSGALDPAGWHTSWLQDGHVLDMGVRNVAGVTVMVISKFMNNKVEFWDRSGTLTSPTDAEKFGMTYSGIFATVTRPLGVAVAGDGTIYCITEGRVVRFTRTALTPVEVIPATALKSPWRLDIASDGTILVAESSQWVDIAHRATTQSPDHHQVKRFSTAGALLATYGRAGGRLKEGLFHDTGPEAGFNNIWDITAFDNAGFVVTEPLDAPRWTSIWNGDGTLRKSLFGPGVYANTAFKDPVHADRWWMFLSFHDITEVVVNETTGAWRPRAVYRFTGLLNGVVPEYNEANAEPLKILQRNGVRYVAIMSNLQLFQIDEAARRMRPLVVGFLSKGAVTPQESTWGITAWGDSYLWTAQTVGDESVDATRVRRGASRQSHARYTMLDDFSILWVDRYGPAPTNAATVNRIARMVPTWNANGIPIYPMWDAATEYYGPIPNTNEIEIAAGSVAGVFDGKLYVSFGGPLSRVGGNLFFNLTCIRMSDNVVLWQRGLADPTAQSDANGVNLPLGTTPLDPEDVKQSMRSAGMDSRGFLIHVDMDSPAQIWDHFGLWIARVFDYRDAGQSASLLKVAGQTHGGGVQDMGNYTRYIGGGYSTSPALALRGWNKFQRKTLNFTR